MQKKGQKLLLYCMIKRGSIEMSYSVVIIEDEQIVREELVSNPLFKELDLLVIGSAENGIDGELLIKEKEPDIIITDIRLPGQDGLKMLSHTDPSHAIILSGHSDFSYMRQAIQLKVADYIKKPIDDEELIASLTLLIQRIAQEEKEVDTLASHTLPSFIIPLPTHLKNHIVDHAIKYVEENYHKSIGLQEAATALGVSEGHLSRLFKEVTEINFLGYLNAYRINKSVELLGNPKLNITNVCSMCGFPTPGYFTKLFRRFYQMTPSQFRDSLEL